MLIEEYINAIESAPLSVQRMLTRLKELDCEVEKEKQIVDEELRGLEACMEREKERSPHSSPAEGKQAPGPFPAAVIDKPLQRINRNYIKILDMDMKRIALLTELFHELEETSDILKEDSALFKERVAKESLNIKLDQTTELLDSQVEQEVRGHAPEEGKQRYCTCRRPFFGDMVACESPECEVEWYHYSCVGLRAAPKGKWTCPECTQKGRSSPRN